MLTGKVFYKMKSSKLSTSRYLVITDDPNSSFVELRAWNFLHKRWENHISRMKKVQLHLNYEIENFIEEDL